ncbi:DUF2842 domain-containing protein [uncultured Sphingomonas sp.]|uniref:DUF2842 domain-containing protein n=1 Tax=uncultured Sphingomonas sp. TaxID=158754 RepID=UPI00374A2181
MTPSWRKPAGALGILAWIIFWVVLITSFSRVIGSWPVLVQALVYLIAGVVWILPLGRVMQWMETGSIHSPRD